MLVLVVGSRMNEDVREIEKRAFIVERPGRKHVDPGNCRFVTGRVLPITRYINLLVLRVE